MADVEHDHENGTSNGDVPEIELIIKVRRRGCQPFGVLLILIDARSDKGN